MPDPIKFSRINPSESAFEAIAARTGDITKGLADASLSLLKQKHRELRLAEPHADGFALFSRIVQAYPHATKVIVDSYLKGLVDDADVAELYAEEA